MANYVTVLEVDTYASERLNSRAWINASVTDRNKAIAQASRMMNRLNFAGSKTDEGQELEFPRNGETVTPQDIKDACSEITIVLLGGANVEKDFEQQKVTSRRYAAVMTTYDPRVVSEHTATGIPSFTAWQLLRPYLADPNGVVLSRVS